MLIQKGQLPSTDCKGTLDLDPPFDQGEAHFFTGECHPKALPLCMESHWARLSFKDTLWSQAMFQNTLLMLPYHPIHRTESEFKKPFQNSSFSYHSAWTRTSTEGLLQLSSSAGGESKVGRLHLTSQHIWQGGVKRMKILSVPVWVHGNSGYKQVVYPPQASCGS